MLACAGSLHATEESNYLQRLLNGAKPGQTVTLPAGEFRGGVSMPAGVSLHGAGYEKTIIDATGAVNGLTVAGGSGTVISNLTVHGASMANVAVRQADRVTIRRVRATGGLIGISVQGGHAVRVENSSATATVTASSSPAE